MKIKLKPFFSRHLLCPLVTVYHRQIVFSDKVRNLGFILDSNLTMKQHVIKICQTAYYELKRISSIRRYLTGDAAKQLITSCVLSRLDYCNSLLMGTPNSVTEFNRCRKSKILVHALFSEHHVIKSAHLSYSNSTGSQFLNE